MKKITILIILLSVLAIGLPKQSKAGFISPGSGFYFLQTWGESLKLFFIFSKEEKIDYLLQLSETRITEITDNPDIAQNNVEAISNRYANHFQKIEELVSQSEDSEQTVVRIKEINLRHQQVLAETYQNASETVQDNILNAQQNSSSNIASILEKTEGKESAEQFMEQVQIIQQTQIQQKAQMMHMENEGPASDPSQTPLKETNSLMPEMPGQNQHQLNQPQELNSDGTTGQQQQQPAAPMPMAPQN